jgi:hypothetical protein
LSRTPGFGDIVPFQLGFLCGIDLVLRDDMSPARLRTAPSGIEILRTQRGGRFELRAAWNLPSEG